MVNIMVSVSKAVNAKYKQCVKVRKTEKCRLPVARKLFGHIRAYDVYNRASGAGAHKRVVSLTCTSENSATSQHLVT